MMDKFYGSKLNTVLLVVLIVLMIIALKVMYKDKVTGAPAVSPNTTSQKTTSPTAKLAVEGRKEDLVSFSIAPNSTVHGLVSYKGSVKGAYFFEGNIRINVLDEGKKVLTESHATATTAWMTSGPVSFAGKLDFTGFPKGEAFVEIQNDNPSGLPENDKSILIPVMID